ncbi:SusC/RagA family TonB-linked outer membrane protein [Chitinophaga lutea]
MRKLYFPRRSAQLVLASLLSGWLLYPGQAQAGSAAVIENSEPFRQQIRGTVSDAATGQPLAGATVGIKGVARATHTDTRGSFAIDAPGTDAVLMVSYIGYVTQEIPVGTQTQIQVSLKALSTDLTQVVVVGYGTQAKKDVTGSVKSLKSETFNKGIINAPQELLQGKVSGVNVTSVSGEPGQNLGITVRGPGSVRSGSTPLFVVDGLPLDNVSTGGGDPLNFLNPADIESMDVLKDASATAIYGSRGANGVILITTRKGKAGTSQLGFNASMGVSKIARPIKLFSADEFRTQVKAIKGQLDDKGGNTDWQDEIMRTALTQNYNLNLSGGAEKLTYFASFGMQKQEGILKANSMDRYSGRFNATQRFWDDRLSVEVNLGVAQTKNERPPISTVLGDALGNNPTYPAYDANGNPARYDNLSNPLIYFDLETDVANITRITGNIAPSLTIVKGLVYKLNFGIDNSNSNRDIRGKASAVPQRDGRLETLNNYNRNRLIENYLTYNTIKGKHNISALAGYSYQRFYVQGRTTSINKFPITPVDPIYNPGIGTELTLANNRPTGYAYVNELQSWFGRVTYQYDDRYLLTANFRADGSTKFGSNNKYGYFPSFSAGWRISEEAFLKNGPFTNLKLRAGWGQTGNQEIPPKVTQALFQSAAAAGSSYPLAPSGPYPSGIFPARFANPNLQWEVSKQTDVGLDFSLLNGDLSGTADWFRKISSNILLIIISADPVQPSAQTWANVPDMEILNQGFEFDLEYRKRISKDFSFHVGGNITFIKNEVRNSPYTVIPSGSAQGSGLTSATINGYINGEPIGAFYLREFIGIGTDSLSKYADTDKDGIISDKDRIVAGTALPNMMYNFQLGAQYKGFDLSANFNGVSGNKVYDNTANSFFYKAKLAKSTNTTAAAVEFPQESINNPASVSTRYLKKGAYLRMNNLTLGYNFNTGALGVKKWFSTLRLSVTGQNLFLITDYDGYDPEVNVDRNIDGATSYGIDYISYPKARSVVFSLNVSF